MKKLLLIFVFGAFTLALSAQTSKKYLLIEHFTNSWCGICKSKNPAFYTTIAPYKADIHHVSIHPPTPYAQCVFYQANKTDNQARANYYGIFGTPQVALNGKLSPTTSSLLPLATLQTALAQNTAPLSIKVTDVIANGTISGTIQVKYDQALPAGTYRIFVAAVEKLVTLTTQNGEKEHQDVFRDMLTAIDGDPIGAGGAAQTTQLSYSVALNPAWNANQMYLLVYILNTGTKEVLNSGTRFDASKDIQEPTPTHNLRIEPNPAKDMAWFSLGDDSVRKVEVVALNGQRYATNFEVSDGRISVAVDQLPKGVYVVKATGIKKVYTGKMVILARE